MGAGNPNDTGTWTGEAGEKMCPKPLWIIVVKVQGLRFKDAGRKPKPVTNLAGAVLQVVGGVFNPGTSCPGVFYFRIERKSVVPRKNIFHKTPIFNETP